MKINVFQFSARKEYDFKSYEDFEKEHGGDLHNAVVIVDLPLSADEAEEWAKEVEHKPPNYGCDRYVASEWLRSLFA